MAEDVLSVRSALASHPLFASCSATQLDRLSRVGTSLVVDAGYVLARAGRRGYELFLVLDGTATAAGDGPVTTLRPGDHFGAAGPRSSARATATVVAETPMRLVAVDSRELNAVLAVHGHAPVADRPADRPLAGAEG